jgi:ketosteroid isomerase-like protein
VTRSPIERLLDAFDRRDVDAVAALNAPDVRILLADGRRAEGGEAVRELLIEAIEPLRSCNHRITAQWHQDEVWIAEVEAGYVFHDGMRLDGLPRAFVLREGPGGIVDLRIYGAHEHPLVEEDTLSRGISIGSRLIPPL